MTTTYEAQDLLTAWNGWHAARERELRTPHGWLSLTDFHWLPSDPAVLAGLPGRWHAGLDSAVLTAGRAAGLVLSSGPFADSPVDGAVTASVAEAGSLLWVQLGTAPSERVQIELVRRGGRYAVRVRDPRAPERAAFTGVPAFEISPGWVRPGRYTPFDAPKTIEVDTARSDLRQHVTAVGTVDVTIDGRDFPLVATAAVGGRLNLSFRDQTNGQLTAPWRVVTTSVPTENGDLVVDFNRTVNLPFSFTEFGTCPAPVAGNTLPLPVTAGELAPIRVTGPAAAPIPGPQR